MNKHFYYNQVYVMLRHVRVKGGEGTHEGNKNGCSFRAEVLGNIFLTFPILTPIKSDNPLTDLLLN